MISYVCTSDYDIVCQPTISYVDIRYPRVPRIQMARAGTVPGESLGSHGTSITVTVTLA